IYSARHIALSHFLLCKLFSAVSDRVREAFSYSDTVLLEIDLHNQETVKRLIRCKNLRRKQTTASYLHPKLHKRVENFMATFRHSLISWAQMQEEPLNDSYRKAREIYENLVGNWDRKRPEWLLFILYQLCENLLDRPTSPMLDVFLANKAYEEEKQIRAIETTHEQCNPIVSLTQDEIIFAINYTISYLEHLHVTQRLFHINTERSVSALVREYRCGNLDDSYFEINDISTTNLQIGEKEKKLAAKIERQLRDDIIVKRNERMANRLNQLLTDNPHLTVFSAIGTGHFFGNVSVLHHLKRMGYIVRSVGENDVIVSPRRRGKKLTFNSLWLREHQTVSTVSIEVIEVNSSNAMLDICSVVLVVSYTKLICL
ncbi:hypothetical protein Angca_010016, partial [Angiostrongylus cantonensis]